jgi:Domain of unknown function (DUF4386)
MNTTHNTTPDTGPSTGARTTALVAGALYLLTFVSSIPALAFLDPVLGDPDYIIGPGEDTRVTIGAALDMVNALACIGTAVALYSVVRRHHERLALGFVTSRLLEAATIVIGVVSLLAVVTLRQDVAGTPGADTGALVTVGHALVAVRDWTFLLGPGLMPACNALLLGTALYKSGLVPRIIPTVGLVGAPLLLGSVVATMFGLHGQTSTTAMIAVLPVAAWELSLGVWLVVKGFRPASSASAPAPRVAVATYGGAA